MCHLFAWDIRYHFPMGRSIPGESGYPKIPPDRVTFQRFHGEAAEGVSTAHPARRITFWYCMVIKFVPLCAGRRTVHALPHGLATHVFLNTNPLLFKAGRISETFENFFQQLVDTMTSSSIGYFSKIDAWTLRAAFAVIAILIGIAASHAEPQSPIRPRLSVAKLAFFKSHPTVWNEFLSKLPRRPSGLPRATRQPVSPPAGGTWQVVTAVPGGGAPGLCDPQLLTDGTVIVHNCDAPDWWKLTPDNTGSYVNGTWTAIASLPVIKGTQYAPQYNASAVLPDGRVIIMGGEYNGGNTRSGRIWARSTIRSPIAGAQYRRPVAPAGPVLATRQAPCCPTVYICLAVAAPIRPLMPCSMPRL